MVEDKRKSLESEIWVSINSVVNNHQYTSIPNKEKKKIIKKLLKKIIKKKDNDEKAAL
jgi:hypothetical protein